ncbi:MAG TPA: hypothetical protein V6D16_13710 [Candidatus Obscuribacterales bacterium]
MSTQLQQGAIAFSPMRTRSYRLRTAPHARTLHPVLTLMTVAVH